MTISIVWFSVLVILSNTVLGNEIEQPAQSEESFTVFHSLLEGLSNAVERLEASLQIKTMIFRMFDVTVEGQYRSLEAELEIQKRILRNLEALLGKVEANVEIQATQLKELVNKVNVQGTMISNLEAKEAWHEPIAHSPTNRTIIAPEGDQVQILCVVHGIPLPEIRWTRENGSLESDRVVVQNYGRVLRIKNARLSDQDTYVCVAANGIGTPATQSVRLQVYNPSQESHRIIESDRGNLAIKTMSSGCLWLIKLQNTTGFRVELDPLMTVPITFISEPNSSNSSVQSIQPSGSKNTSIIFEGKSLAIVVPPGRERTTLSWTGLDVDDSGVSSSAKFVKDMEGTLEWESQHDGADKIFWAIDLKLSGELNWTLDTATTEVDVEGSSQNICFSVLQIRPDGITSEVQRTCDGSSDGSLKLGISSQVLVLVNMKSLDTSRSKLRLSWTHHDQRLEKTVDGIIAITDVAFVIPFNSFIIQVVLPGWITGVTYDWNSRKIYYSKYGVGIMRSNLNGSESEILLSDDAYSLLDGMTIEPASGNLYYGNQSSETIRVCDNDVKNCSTIANSNDLTDIRDVAVHLSKGLLFWSIAYGYLYRANLDGSNATVVLERRVLGLDVDELEDRIYWGSDEGFGSCDMNGQDIRELLNITWEIWDVAIDNDKVYLGNLGENDIRVTSKLGTNSTMVAQLRSNVNSITLFGTRVSNRPLNPCAEAKCAHLCVLVTRWTYRCTCPDGQVLNADGKTCNV